MVAIPMQRLLVVDFPCPFTPHRGLIDPQVVVVEGQTGELDQPRMHEEVVQSWAPWLWEAAHTVELGRAELATRRRAVTDAGTPVVVGESVGGEQAVQVVSYRIDVAPRDQAVNEGPAFALPLVRGSEQVVCHGVKGRRATHARDCCPFESP